MVDPSHTDVVLAEVKNNMFNGMGYWAEVLLYICPRIIPPFSENVAIKFKDRWIITHESAFQTETLFSERMRDLST